jgi:hypothetical protein
MHALRGNGGSSNQQGVPRYKLCYGARDRACRHRSARPFHQSSPHRSCPKLSGSPALQQPRHGDNLARPDTRTYYGWHNEMRKRIDVKCCTLIARGCSSCPAQSAGGQAASAGLHTRLHQQHLQDRQTRRAASWLAKIREERLGSTKLTRCTLMLSMKPMVTGWWSR